ncbi:MAG TPA: hypothetical protein VFJ16_21980 [Longimicrobium sp.]|nr:hypothetical protein [Longimicrobium sp.]
MHALKTLVAAVAASLALNACATSGGTGLSTRLAAGPMANGTQLVAAENKAAGSGAVSMPATVRVSNFNWMDVNVYAVQGGTRVRLGTVTSMSNGTFQLPSRFLQQSSSVRLLVDPIGSTEGYMTDGILVHGGQQISFSVQNSLQFSSFSVAGR